MSTSRSRRDHRRWRRRLWPALLLAGVVALLWPARWGGLFGLTMVAGDSMQPTMHDGDMAVTLKRHSYGVGDAVVFPMPGLDERHVIHRIVDVDGEGRFTTQGDNRTTEDSWPVDPGSVLGEQVFVIPRCEAAICAGLPLPVLFGIALLGLAAGLWVYAAVREPRVPEHPVMGPPGTEARTLGGLTVSEILRDAGPPPEGTNIDPLLDAATNDIVGLRVTTVADQVATAPCDGDLTAHAEAVCDYGIALLCTARDQAEFDLVVLVAPPALPTVPWAERLLTRLEGAYQLHSGTRSGGRRGGLAVEMRASTLARPSAASTCRQLSSEGIGVVISDVRPGLLANRRALRRRAECLSADAICVDISGHDLEQVGAAARSLGAVIATSVQETEQLETLYRHGLRWWSGPLAGVGSSPVGVR